MWAHCLRLCFTFSSAFVFYILILSVGEAVWRRTSH
jgi:hypothetical protein